MSREIQNSEFLKRTAPALSLLNISEESVMIQDVSKQPKRIAEITVQNGKYICLLDDSDSCQHIKYMLILPETVKFKHKVKSI